MKRGGTLTRSPMARGTSTLKRSRVKARNPERRAATFERAYGGDDRRAWIERQPCLICGVTPSVNAHVGPKGSKGTGYKADACWTVPLCSPHHDEEHQGHQTFEATYGIDLEALAQITDARWQQHVATHTSETTDD